MSDKNQKLRKIFEHHGNLCCWCSTPLLCKRAYHTILWKGLDVSAHAEGSIEYHFANQRFTVDMEHLRPACVGCVRETAPVPWVSAMQSANRPTDKSRGLYRLRAVLERDGSQCWMCEHPILPAIDIHALFEAGDESFRDYRMATLDHYIPRAAGGSNATKNMRAACYRCNHERGCVNPWHLGRSFGG